MGDPDGPDSAPPFRPGAVLVALLLVGVVLAVAAYTLGDKEWSIGDLLFDIAFGLLIATAVGAFVADRLGAVERDQAARQRRFDQELQLRLAEIESASHDVRRGTEEARRAVLDARLDQLHVALGGVAHDVAEVRRAVEPQLDD
jgi:hypothetical protein